MKDPAAKEAKETAKQAKAAKTTVAKDTDKAAAAKDKATARVTAPFHAKVTHAQGSATGNGAPSTAAAAGVAKEANIPEEGADATVQGGCICTKIQFTVKSRPQQVVHCHCIDCRRSTGAPLTTWASYPRQARSLLRMNSSLAFFVHS